MEVIEQPLLMLKSNIFDKFLTSQVTQAIESSCSIKLSQRHISINKSESLANLIGKSSTILFGSDDLDDDKLSICEGLEVGDS